MNSMRCPQCGLVNFATAAECKRCQVSFAVVPGGVNPWAAPSELFYRSPEPDTSGKNADLAKFSQAMALFAIVLMALAKFMHVFLLPVALLMLFTGLVTGIAALVKLRKRADQFGGKRAAIGGIIINGILLVLISVAVMFVFGVNVLRSAAVANAYEVRDKPQWREHKSAAAGFTAQFPGQPSEESQTENAPGLGAIPIMLVGSGAPDESAAVVAVADYSGILERLKERMSPSQIENEVINSSLSYSMRKEGIMRTGERKVSLGGYRGAEADFFGPPTTNPAARLRGVARVYWAPPKVYVLAIAAPERSALYNERLKFMDSFRLLQNGQ